jgi:hypothetical protein
MNKRNISIMLTTGESLFPMDSFPGTAKKRYPIRKIKIYSELERILSEQRRAMIDLDGTIHKYSKGFADGTIYDEPFEKARTVLNWLKNKGFEIVIFTTRASKENAGEMGGDHTQEIAKVESWLKQNNIPFDRVTAEKLAADFYIDDKAIRIEGGDWDSVFQKLKTEVG